MTLKTNSKSAREAGSLHAVTVKPVRQLMKKNVLIGLVLAAFTLPGVSTAQQPVDLFNGTNLNGWVQHGGKATYTVENGEIVGTSTLNTPNTFLCTTKDYSDFILEYDFKVDSKLNSGVQFRSLYFNHATEAQWNGKTIKGPANRVHGYQCEIDPDVARGRMWSGGIYDEGRRGWLFPTGGEKSAEAQKFSAQGRKIFNSDDWNHVRIEAIGDSIKTWLNGTPCADIKDDLTLSGFIALQVHAIDKDETKNGTQVRWRNLKLTEVSTPANILSHAEKSAGWQLLWDGKTSEGWRGAKSDGFPTEGWDMKDGVLTVHENGGEESAAGGDIITRKRYANFELTADFKITPGANSGIKIFVQPNLSPIDKVTGQPTGQGSAIGLEFQILDDARHPDAKLGMDGNRTIGSLYDLIPAPKDKVVMPVGEWNHVRILSQRQHVTFWLNGEKTVEFDRHSPEFRAAVAGSKYHNIPKFGDWAAGHILLQEHGNEVSFHNVKLRELPAN